MKFFYECSECRKHFKISPDLMVCPECSLKQQENKPLRGVLEVSFDGEVSKDFDIFDLLPVEKEYFPPIPVGNTPLWTPHNLRKKTGFDKLYIKDDSLNPTGSLKDRASYLVAAFALREKIPDVVVASTGNAASSMAGVGAAAGLNIKIFIPATAPQAKRIQALQYGAKVIEVDGTYDKAYELSLEYTKTHGGLSRNTAYNPLTIEGKKTVALEIYKQLGAAQLGAVPDWIFVSAGDGVIIGGLYKGLQDLLHLGLIKRMPVICAVQAEGSNAICHAFRNGDFIESYSSNTVADSISVDVPRNGYYAVKYLHKYDGRCVEVTDREILAAQKELASTTGLFAEPAASASLAGFLKEKNSIPHNDTVVILVTGNGLKDIDAAKKGLRK
ncbi:MAG: threonine synthase [Spirochaetota bacterium]|nr:MAG: threonine synthase [Spirochaetota bacterium]